MSALETIDIKNGLHVLLLKIELSIENATDTETKLKREAQRELLARAITHISLLDDKIAHYTHKQSHESKLSDEVDRLKRENKMLKEQLKF